MRSCDPAQFGKEVGDLLAATVRDKRCGLSGTSGPSVQTIKVSNQSQKNKKHKFSFPEMWIQRKSTRMRSYNHSNYSENHILFCVNDPKTQKYNVWKRLVEGADLFLERYRSSLWISLKSYVTFPAATFKWPTLNVVEVEVTSLEMAVQRNK